MVNWVGSLFTNDENYWAQLIIDIYSSYIVMKRGFEQWWSTNSPISKKKRSPPTLSNLTPKDHYIWRNVIIIKTKVQTSPLIHRYICNLTDFLAILFRPLLISCLQRLLNYLVSNLLTFSLPDEDYSRNTSCALNYISTFSLMALKLEIIDWDMYNQKFV